MPDLVEWDYGAYEGWRSVDIRKERPGWNVFRDGCPGGETPAQVSDRADRLIVRLRSLAGAVALFSHGQFWRVLAVRWIGLPLVEAQHFQLDTASLSVLGSDPRHPEVPVIASWNTTGDAAGGSSGATRVLGAAGVQQSALERWENKGGGQATKEATP